MGLNGKAACEKPWLLGTLTCLIGLLSACEQKRNPEFVQGDGQHLYAIDDIKSRTALIQTGSRLKEGIASVTAASKLVSSKDGSSLIVAKDIVNFQLKDYPFDIDSKNYQYNFFGEENTAYQVVYTLTERHLIVNKLTEASQLASNERTYATKIEADLYQVPMFGFPIEKHVIERVIDNRGKKTDRLKTIKVEYLSEATHISFNQSDIEFFEPASKKDTIPAEIFADGDEWYYTKTLVDRPAIPRGEICPNGRICNELGMQEADGKISFRKTQNSIVALDVNIPDETPKERARSIILEIPVSWVDFNISQNGLSEELMDDSYNGARPWHQRQYASLDLKRVDNISAANSGNYKIENLEISKDYIGFKVFESESQKSYFYSLAKAPKDSKQPRLYPISDHKKFGFFPTFKSTIQGDINTNRTEEIDSLIYLNRIYPRNGENHITIYLTKDSAKHPKGDYAQAVSDAITSWNEAFSKAGVGFTLKFGGSADDQRVENGDVRYHKVAIYADDRRSGLLGYGPSVSDTKTGETYSSSNHIYLRNYKQGLKSSIQNFIYWQLGAFDGVDLGPIEDIIDSNNRSENKASQWVADLKTRSNQFEMTFDNQFFLDYSRIVNSKDAQDQSDEPDQDRNAHLQKYTCSYLENSMPITIKKIQEKCLTGEARSSRFANYLNLMKSEKSSGETRYAMSFTDDDGVLDEAAALEDCASRLIGDKLRATLVHEFGHNFGLRHNFAASSDKSNLRIDPENKKTQTSASVMDYAHNDAERNINLGAYDFAAIRYGYANEVEIINKQNPNDRKFIKIPNGHSIAAAISQYPDYKLKSYKFCSDEDVSNAMPQIPEFDPQCKRWDNGSTVVETVKDTIQQMSAYILTNSKRIDRESGFPNHNQFNTTIERRYLMNLQQIYGYYRWLLAGKNTLATEQQLYLRGLDKGALKSMKDTARARFGDEFIQYEQAADLIKSFLTNIVFNLNNKYCVMTDSNDEFSIPYAVVFGVERTRLVRELDTAIEDCDHEKLRPLLIEGYIEHQRIFRHDFSDNPNANYVISSFGVPIEILEMRNENNPLEFKITEHGLYGLREAASRLMFDEMYSATNELAKLDYAPSIADEPEIRETALDLLEKRLLKGVALDTDVSTFSESNLKYRLGEVLNVGFTPDFKSEYDIYNSIIESIKPSLSYTDDRSLSFSFQAPSALDADRFKQRQTNIDTFAVLKDGGKYWFAKKGVNHRAAAIVSKLNLLLAGQEAYGFQLQKYDQSSTLSAMQLEAIRSTLSDRLMPTQSLEEIDAIIENQNELATITEQLKGMALYYQRYEEDVKAQISQLRGLLNQKVI